jgi:curved DNA-binding protein CbpA
MAIDPDPYRTLGLARDATREEIRVAYRRLAKIHHPDAAGPSALPRFLAIQAAYEQLIHGTTSAGRGGQSPAARRAWDADPERADATRRAYGGRARTAPPSGARPSGGATTGSTGATGGTSTAGRTRSSGGSSGASGGSSGATGANAGETSGSSGTQAGSTGRRRNKATLGSTSYDDAEGMPFEPDWAGASWYGTTSGTYWTLNPKEYADPRKHGPEYQARAKRAARAWSARGGGPEPDAEGASAEGDPEDVAAGAPAMDADAPDAGPPPDAAPTAKRGSPWWASSAGPQAATESAARRPQGGGRRWWSDDRRSERRARPGDARRADDHLQPPPDLGRAAADIARAMTDDHFGGPRGRLVRAVIGWLPIAFGIGWAFGEITGCGRFAASCDGTADPFVMLIQAAVFALLLLVPALASLATVAAMALVGAALVGTFILSATGTAGDADARRQALGAVLLVAWLAGFGIAIGRRLRDLPTHGRPVS